MITHCIWEIKFSRSSKNSLNEKID
uniref:Uncharacterized protein n=1 Tax=Anguilla anguilla TaxID=7936 RepID=A0A0E9QCV7_ANGAN